MSFRGTQFPNGSNPNLSSLPQTNPYTPNNSNINYNNNNSINNNNNNNHNNNRSRRSNSVMGITGLERLSNLIPSNNPYVIKFESFTDTVDEKLDNYLGFFKPYVPSIGRVLIVATFLEDSIRIVSQWRDQVYYLSTFRHLYEWFVKIFLILNILAMVSGSILVIIRKQPEISTIFLISDVLLQGLVYGLFTQLTFFLRNVSVIGGLLLAFSDCLIIDKRSLLVPGLPMVETTDNKKYFLLAGRIMLIVLFLAFIFNVHLSIFTFFIILIGLLSCVAIAIGYKTKFFASIMTLLLLIFNIYANHYWSYTDSRRDYLKYEFFQTLSIVGGLLLIVNTGAGELSIDEKKKIY
ncbi:hypothetical protein BVG19_g3155 [[Candida] boidinii]|nr:hypothetical protein BVG19_g3155 [[Candida] boidinii]OWB52438.1 hypothetical protein B5S27_g4013 [[Candida] boidinii]